MLPVLFFVWAATWRQVATEKAFVLQQGTLHQCQNLQLSQFHQLLQDFIVDMPMTLAADKNAFSAYIDEKYFAQSNHTGFTTRQKQDVSSVSKELQQLIEQYLQSSSTSLQEIAILLILYPDATIPVGIRELLEYEDLFRTESALTGCIRHYEKNTSPSLLSTIADLHVLHPHVTIPDNVWNDLKEWNLLPSGDQQIRNVSYPPMGALGPSLSSPTPLISRSVLTQRNNDINFKLQSLWLKYSSSESELVLKEISELILANPTLKVNEIILQELKAEKHLENPYIVTITLINEYNEKPTISVLQRIREIQKQFPYITVPVEIAVKISELVSYDQIIINQLVHEYQVTGFHEVLVKIEEIAQSSTEVKIPAYIIEKISETHDVLYSFQEKVVHTLILKYIENQSCGILQEILGIARDDHSLHLPAFIVYELSKTSLSAPSQYYFQELLNEYYITKSQEKLMQINKLKILHPDLIMPPSVENVIKEKFMSASMWQNSSTRSVISTPQILIEQPKTSRLGRSTNFFSNLTLPRWELQNVESHYEFSKLTEEYQLTKSRSSLYKIVAMARSNPYLYLEPSIASLVFSCFNRTEGSTLQYLNELLSAFRIQNSAEVLWRIEELCNFNQNCDLPNDVESALISLRQSPLLFHNQSLNFIAWNPLANIDSVYTENLIGHLILLYEKTHSEIYLIEILELMRANPCVVVPLTIINLITLEREKASQLQLYVDKLVSRYLSTNSVEILEEIIVTIHNHPEVYFPFSVLEAVVQHSETFSTASLELEYLIKSYYLSKDRAILLTITDILLTHPTLPVPVPIALECVEILRNLLATNVSHEDEKYTNEIDIILQKSVLEYTETKTLENLVKIVQFVSYHPGLKVSYFIAKQIASIAHLTGDEVKLKILIEQYLTLPTDILLSEIANLRLFVPNVLIPVSISTLLDNLAGTTVSTTSFLTEYQILEGYIHEYYRMPSFVILTKIADFIAAKPYLPVPQVIARLLVEREERLSHPEVLIQELIDKYLSSPSKTLLVDITALAKLYPNTLLRQESVESGAEFMSASTSIATIDKDFNSLIQEYKHLQTDTLLFLILELFTIYPQYPMPEFIIFQKLILNYLTTRDFELLKNIVLLLPSHMETYVPESIIADALESRCLPSESLKSYSLLRYLTVNYPSTKSSVIILTIRELVQNIEDRKIIETVYDELLPLVNDIEPILQNIVSSGGRDQATRSNYVPPSLNLAEQAELARNDLLIRQLTREYEMTKSKTVLYRIIAIVRTNFFAQLPSSIAFAVFSGLSKSEGSISIYLEKLIKVYYTTRSLAVLARIAQLCNFDLTLAVPTDVKSDLISMRLTQGSESSPKLDQRDSSFAKVIASLSDRQDYLRQQILIANEKIVTASKIISTFSSTHLNAISETRVTSDTSSSELNEIVTVVENTVAIVSNVVSETEKLLISNQGFVAYANGEIYDANLLETQSFIMNLEIAEAAVNRCIYALNEIVTAAEQGNISTVSINTALLSVFSTYVSFPIINYERINTLVSVLSIHASETRKTLLTVTMPTWQTALETHVRVQVGKLDCLKLYMAGATLRVIPTTDHTKLLMAFNHLYSLISALTRVAEFLSTECRKILDVSQAIGARINKAEINIFIDNINMATICLDKATDGMITMLNASVVNELSPIMLQNKFTEILMSIVSLRIVDSVYDDLFSKTTCLNNFKQLEITGQNTVRLRIPAKSYFQTSINLSRSRRAVKENDILVNSLSSNGDESVEQSYLLKTILNFHHETLVGHIRKYNQITTDLHHLVSTIVGKTGSSLGSIAVTLKGIAEIIDLFGMNTEKIQQANQEFVTYATDRNFSISHVEARPFLRNYVLAEKSLTRSTEATMTVTDIISSEVLKKEDMRSALDHILEMYAEVPTCNYILNDFKSSEEINSTVSYDSILSVIMPSRLEIVDKYIEIQITRSKTLKQFFSKVTNQLIETHNSSSSLSRLLQMISSLTKEANHRVEASRKIVKNAMAKGSIIYDADVNIYIENINIAATSLIKGTTAISSIVDAYFMDELLPDSASDIFTELLESIHDRKIIESIHDDLFSLAGDSEYYVKDRWIAKELAAVFKVLLPYRHHALKVHAEDNKNGIEEVRRLINILMGTDISSFNLWSQTKALGNISSSDMLAINSSFVETVSLLHGILAIVDKLIIYVDNIQQKNQEFINYAGRKEFYVSYIETQPFLRNIILAEIAIGRCAGTTKSLMDAAKEGMLNIAAQRAILENLLDINVAFPQVGFDNAEFWTSVIMEAGRGVDVLYDSLSELASIDLVTGNSIVHTVLPGLQVALERQIEKVISQIKFVKSLFDSVMLLPTENTLHLETEGALLLKRVFSLIDALSNEVVARASANHEIVSSAVTSVFTKEQVTLIQENIRIAAMTMGRLSGTIESIVSACTSKTLHFSKLSGVMSNLIEFMSETNQIDKLSDDILSIISQQGLSAKQVISSSEFPPISDFTMSYDFASLLRIFLPTRQAVLERQTTVMTERLYSIDNIIENIISAMSGTEVSSIKGLTSLLEVVFSTIKQYEREIVTRTNANRVLLNYVESKNYDITITEIVPFVENTIVAMTALGRLGGANDALLLMANEGFLNAVILRNLLKDLVEVDDTMVLVGGLFDDLLPFLDLDRYQLHNFVEIVLPQLQNTANSIDFRIQGNIQNLLSVLETIQLIAASSATLDSLSWTVKTVRDMVILLAYEAKAYLTVSYKIYDQIITTDIESSVIELNSYWKNLQSAASYLGRVEAVAQAVKALGSLDASLAVDFTEIINILLLFDSSIRSIESIYDEIPFTRTEDISKDYLLAVIFPTQMHHIEKQIALQFERTETFRSLVTSLILQFNQNNNSSRHELAAVLDMLLRVVVAFSREAEKCYLQNKRVLFNSQVEAYAIQENDINIFVENMKVASSALGRAEGIIRAVAQSYMTNTLSVTSVELVLSELLENLENHRLIDVAYDCLLSFTEINDQFVFGEVVVMPAALSKMLEIILPTRLESLNQQMALTKQRVESLFKLASDLLIGTGDSTKLLDVLSDVTLSGSTTLESYMESVFTTKNDLCSDRMISVMIGVLSIVKRLTISAENWVIENRNFVEYASKHNFLVSVAETEQYQNNIKLAESALGRSSGAALAIVNAAEHGLLNIAALKTTFEGLLQLSMPFRSVDFDFNDYISITSLADVEARRNVLSITMPSRLSVLEELVATVKDRVQGLLYLAPTLSIAIRHQSISFQSLILILDNVFSVVSTLIKHCERLMNANRALVSSAISNNYLVSDNELETFSAHTAESWTALGALNGATVALSNLYMGENFTIIELGSIATALLKTVLESELVDSIYDQALSSPTIDTAIFVSEAKFNTLTKSDTLVDSEFASVLQAILPARQEILVKQTGICDIRYEEIRKLLSILLEGANNNTLGALANEHAIVNSINELIGLLIVQAHSITDRNKLFISHATSQNFIITYSEAMNFMTDTRAASISLGRFLGAAQAVTVAANAGALNLNFMAELLRNLLKIIIVHDDFDFLADIKNIIDISGNLSMQKVSVLANWQLSLENEMSNNNVKVHSVVSFIEIVTSDIDVGKIESAVSLVELLKGAMSIINSLTREMNLRLEENKILLSLIINDDYQTSDINVHLFVSNARFVSVALGRISGLTSALIQSYSERKLNVTSVFALLPQMMSLIAIQPEIDEVFDVLFPLITSLENVVSKSNVMREVLQMEIKLLAEKVALTLNRFGQFEVLVSAFLIETENISGGAVGSALTGILSLVRYHISNSEARMLEIGQRKQVIELQSWEEIKHIAESYKACFTDIGLVNGAIDATVIAINTGMLNYASIWDVIKKILEIDGSVKTIEILFDDLTTVFLIGDVLTRRMVLSLMLTQRQRMIETRLLSIEKLMHTVEALVTTISEKCMQSNTTVSHTLIFEFEAVITFATALINKAKLLIFSNGEFITHAAEMEFEITVEQTIMFVEAERASIRFLSEAEGACIAVKSHEHEGLTLTTALQEIDTLLLSEKLLYEIRTIIAHETILRELLVHYSSNHGFSYLKQISSLISDTDVDVIPVEILEEIKHLGLYPGMEVTEQQELLQLFEGYIEIPLHENFLQICVLLEKHPEVDIPDAIFEQLISEQISIKSEHYLKHLLLFYFHHPRSQVVELIGQMIEAFPEVELPVAVIEQLLQQGVTSEVLIAHLIREFRISGSLKILQIIAEVNEKLYPNYPMPEDVLQSFTYHNILVRSQSFYVYLIQLNKSNLSSNNVKFIGELIDTFPEVQVPSNVLEELVAGGIVSRTVLLEAVESYKQESSQEMLQIIADLYPLFSDVVLPEYILILISQLRITLIAQSRESHLAGLVGAYEGTFSLEQLAEISELSEALPAFALPTNVMEQVSLYKAISKEESATVSEIKHFSLIVALSSKYPQIPIPLKLQEELSFYLLMLRLEESFSSELLLEIGRLSSKFPHIPLSTTIEKQLQLLEMIDIVNKGEGSAIIIQQIANLSEQFPLIAVPPEISEMIRLLHLVEAVSVSSSPLMEQIDQIALLSAHYSSIQIPASIQQVILLKTLIDEVMTSEVPSLFALQEIVVLSQKFLFVLIPSKVQEQITLIGLIEKVISGTEIDVTILKQIIELSNKYNFIIFPNELSQLILLLQLVEEATVTKSVSNSLIWQIAFLLHKFPTFPVTASVKEQVQLVELIEEIMRSESPSLGSVKIVSQLTEKHSFFLLPEKVKSMIVMIQLLDELSMHQNVDILIRVCELQKSATGIVVSSSVLNQCRLLDLTKETAIALSELTEIRALASSFSFIPLPEKIQQEIALVELVEKASQMTIVSISILEKISHLSSLYPQIEIPIHIIEQILLLTLIKGAEQSDTVRMDTIKQISLLAIKYAGFPIPLTIQNEIVYVELLERFEAVTVTYEMAQKFAALAESDTKIVLSHDIQQSVHLVQLIDQALKTDTSDAVWLIEILELSLEYPSIMVPSSILLKIRLIKLCQTIENLQVYLPAALEEINELSSAYKKIKISLYVQKLIELYKTIQLVTETSVVSQQILTTIRVLAPLYPFVPIPIIIEQHLRLVTLLEIADTKSDVSCEVFLEMQQLSRSMTDFSLRQDSKEIIRLCQLASLEELTVENVREIEAISQKYSFMIVPELIRQQIILINKMELVSHAPIISFEILQEIKILHEKFPFIVLTEKVQRLIVLVRLCTEAMSSTVISLSILHEIETIFIEYPNILLPETIFMRLLLVKFLRQAEISQSPEVILLEISQLLEKFDNIELPAQIKEQLLMILFINDALEAPSAELIQKLTVLSSSYPSILLPDIIQLELHLLQLVEAFLAQSVPDQEILLEIFNIHQIVPIYPIPEQVYQQMELQQMLLEVESLLAASESISTQILDYIDELCVFYPLYPISPAVLELLVSRREVKQLLLYIELAHVTPTIEILEKIEALSRLHPTVHIPENIHMLILQHIQKLYFSQLIEEVMREPSPTKSLIDEIELHSQTFSDVEIPQPVLILITRYRQERQLEQLINEAQSSLSPSITLLERIFELSQGLPEITLPPILEQQLTLLQLIKTTSPSLEVLDKINQLSSAFPAISIPIALQQQLILLQLIGDAMMTSSPPYALLEQIAHSVDSFPNIILPEIIQSQISEMKMTVRLEQLIKVIEQSTFPSPLVLKEISELSKLVKSVLVPISIRHQIRLQELIVEVQEGRALVDSLKEIATILASIPNAPIPQSIKQQLILLQLMEEVLQSPNSAATTKLKQISQLSASYPLIPVPDSVRLMIEKALAPIEAKVSLSEPVGANFAQLQQLVTMYDRMQSPLILRQISQILPSVPTFPLPERITRALLQVGLLSSEQMPSKKLQALIKEYTTTPSETVLNQISQIAMLVPNATLPTPIQHAICGSQINAAFSDIIVIESSSPGIIVAADTVDELTLNQRQVALSIQLNYTTTRFDQARNTLWALRDSVRASGHPMHRSTLATFSNVLNQINMMITQAEEISTDVQERLFGKMTSPGDLLNLSVKIRTAYELLGKSDGARKALLLEAKKFSHFIKMTNDKLLGTATNMKQDIDKVIFDLGSLTSAFTK